MEAVISGLSDEFPNVLRSHKIILTFFCCFIGYLLGLPMCTRVGEFHQLLIILYFIIYLFILYFITCNDDAQTNRNSSFILHYAFFL